MNWSDTLRERQVIEDCRQHYYDQMAGLNDDYEDDYEDDEDEEENEEEDEEE